MEYDNDDNSWRRPSTTQQNKCHRIPKRSTTTAVVVLGLAVLSCLLGYCVLSETLPYESKTLRLVIIVSGKIPCTTLFCVAYRQTSICTIRHSKTHRMVSIISDQIEKMFH